MEQIFILEVFVKKILLNIEPPQKNEYELQQELEEQKREAEALRAAEAAGKKGKKKPPKPKKKKKGKKEPPGPSVEELKFMKTCTVQMTCMPLFDFYIAHDNFVPPPPPPTPPKKGKGKKAKKSKPKKNKKPVPLKIVLPSEPLPQPPYFGVGNSMVFTGRPDNLAEIFKITPISITVWNRDNKMNCIGTTLVEWHDTFIQGLSLSQTLNPVDLDTEKYKFVKKPEIVTNTVALTRPIICEGDLRPCGEVEFIIRLSCLGDRIISNVISLPEVNLIPGRRYLSDENAIKELEIIRHWEGTDINDLPTVPYIFGAPDITIEPVRPEEVQTVFEDYVCPYNTDELAILAMGLPKGPCGGTNCPKRMENKGSQHLFIPGAKVDGKYVHGQFVNKRDVHGPCGRLDCPLAKKIRLYLKNAGSYKPCQKPCPESYYRDIVSVET